MQYNLAEKNMHNYILYITLLTKYAPRLHTVYYRSITWLCTLVLDITLLKTIMHSTCYRYNMWGCIFFKYSYIFISPKIDIEVHIFLIKV